MVTTQKIKELLQKRIDYWEDECEKNDNIMKIEGHESYEQGYQDGEAEGQRSAYYRALQIIIEQLSD